MKELLLSGERVKKDFGESHILQEADIAVYKGDFTVIMGSSGAGKSTLLYTLSGMDTVSGGSVIYNGEDITRFTEKKLTRLRAGKIGFVFHNIHLVSNLSLYENIVVSGYVAGKETEKAVRKNAADEPTGSLNKADTLEVMNLFSALNREGQSVLLVTHDKEAALRGNHILYLEDGMNEKGLCISVNMIQDGSDIDQYRNNTNITTTTTIRLLLDKAANVDEAVELLNSYDLHASMNYMVHFAIADASFTKSTFTVRGNGCCHGTGCP